MYLKTVIDCLASFYKNISLKNYIYIYDKKLMKFISIKTKLTLSFMTLLIFTVLTLGVTGYFVIKHYLEGLYQQELESDVVKLAHDVEDVLSEDRALLISIAAGKQLENYHISHNDKTLEDYFRQFNGYRARKRLHPS